MKYLVFSIKNLSVLVIVILLMFILNTKYQILDTINAQQAETTLPLSVFPAIQEKEVVPGDKTRLQIQFKNGRNTVISGLIKTADFIVKDNEGTPIIIEGESVKPKYSAAAWIRPGYNEISIPPNDFVTVDLFITVPQEVAACGHYAMVYFEPNTNTSAPTTKQTITANAVTTKIVGLINLKVQGRDCIYNLQVRDFKTGSDFQEYGPINVGFDLYNYGDVHVVPKGILTLINPLGQVVSQETVEGKRIFPEAAKSYQEKVGSRWMLGRYKLSLRAVTEGKSSPAEASLFIWIIPWKVIALVLLALLLLALFGKTFWSKIVVKEQVLEEEIEHEREEIEELKKKLHERDE